MRILTFVLQSLQGYLKLHRCSAHKVFWAYETEEFLGKFDIIEGISLFVGFFSSETSKRMGFQVHFSNQHLNFQNRIMNSRVHRVFWKTEFMSEIN